MKKDVQDSLDLLLTSEEMPFLSTMIEALATTSGIGASIFSPSYDRIIGPFNHCDFCTLIFTSPQGLASCSRCDRRHFPRNDNVEPYKCHAGLWDFSVPIMVRGKVIGAIFGGQMRMSHLTNDDFRQLEITAKKYSLDKFQLYEAASKLPVRGRDETNNVIDLVKAIAATIASLVEGRAREHSFLLELTGTRDVAGLSALIMDYVNVALSADACSVFRRRTPPPGSPHGQDTFVLLDTSSELLRPRINDASYQLGQGLTGWVAARGRPLRIANVVDKAELAKISKKLSWRSLHPETRDPDNVRRYLAVPLVVGEPHKVIGVLRAVRTKGKPEFSILDEATMQSLAQLVVSAIENARSREDAERRSAELQALGKAANTLNQGLDTELTLGSIIRIWTENLVTSNVDGQSMNLYVLQHSPERKKFTLVAGGGAGYDEKYRGRQFDDRLGLAGQVLRKHGKPYICHDTGYDRNYNIEVVRGLSSVVVVPLRSGDQIVGVLSWGSLVPHAFMPQEVDTLSKFAEHVGVALNNSRLYEQAKIPVEILDSAVKRLSEAGEWWDIDRLVAKEIVDATRDKLKATACSLFRLHQCKLFLMASTDDTLMDVINMKDPASRPYYEIGQGLTGGVARLCRPVRIDSVENGEELIRYKDGDYVLRYSGHILESSLDSSSTWQSFLGVPIVFNDELLGVLRLSRSGQDRPFWKDEEELVVKIAHQAALALQFMAAIQDRELVVRRFSHDAGDPILQLESCLDAITSSQIDDLSAAREYVEHFKCLVDTYRYMGMARSHLSPTDIQPYSMLIHMEPILRDLNAAKCHIRIKYEIPEDLWVQADKSQLHVILFNVLMNALRASDGLVQVSAKETDDCWEFVVENDGKGFEWRGTPLFSMDMHQGLGIIDSLVKSHHGSFRAELRPGGGTKATLSIARGQSAGHP